MLNRLVPGRLLPLSAKVQVYVVRPPHNRATALAGRTRPDDKKRLAPVIE
jgi:hypothetical protein